MTFAYASSVITQSNETGKSITAVASITDGIRVTVTAHGYANGNAIEITGTTDYDGGYLISNVATDTFDIVDQQKPNKTNLVFTSTQTGTAARGDSSYAGMNGLTSVTRTIIGGVTNYVTTSKVNVVGVLAVTPKSEKMVSSKVPTYVGTDYNEAAFAVNGGILIVNDFELSNGQKIYGTNVAYESMSVTDDRCCDAFGFGVDATGTLIMNGGQIVSRQAIGFELGSTLSITNGRLTRVGTLTTPQVRLAADDFKFENLEVVNFGIFTYLSPLNGASNVGMKLFNTTFSGSGVLNAGVDTVELYDFTPLGKANTTASYAVQITDGNLIRFYNPAFGADMSSMPSISQARASGSQEAVGQADFTILDASGSPLSGGKFYAKDYNNGNRRNLAAGTVTNDSDSYPAIDYVTDRTDSGTLDANGRGTGEMLIANINRGLTDTYPGAFNTGPNIIDKRTKTTTVGEALVDYFFFEYGSQPMTVEVDFYGVGRKAVERRAVADALITEATKATVDAYTDFDTAQKIYDRSASYLKDSWGTYLAMFVGRSGNQLVLGAKNLILNTALTPDYAYDGTTISAQVATYTGGATATTGKVTVAGGTILSGGTFGCTVEVNNDSDGDTYAGVSITKLKHTGTGTRSITFDAASNVGEIEVTGGADLTVYYDGAGTPTLTQTSGTITLVQNVNTVTVTSDQSGSLVQIFTTGTQTVLASATGASLAYDHSDETVDIVVQKAGFLPQRRTSVVLSGDSTQAFSLEPDYNYDAAHGLTYTTGASWSRANNQLTVPTFGPSVRGVYSLMIDAFIAESSLRNTPFNLSMNGPTSLFLVEGAEGATDASITNMQGGGVRYISVAGATTAEFVGFTSTGVEGGCQPEYELGDGSAIADARATGNVDEIIKTYGDASHGNFDKRGHIQFKVQCNGHRQAEFNVLTSYGIPTLEPTLYIISLPMLEIAGLVLGDPSATGLSITDDSAAPVSWDAGDGVKDYSLTVTDAGANSGNTILRWLNYFLSLDATFQGRDPFDWPEMVINTGVAYETLTGILHGVPDTLVGVRVIRTGGIPHPDFTRFQSDDGTYGTPPAQGTIAISGAVAGSRILVRNDTANTAISNVVGTGYSDTYVEGTDFTTGDTIEVTVTHVDKLEQVYTGVISSSGYTLVIAQSDDDVYIAKGFDGSTFTGITFNTTTIDLDLDGSEDPIVLWGETYARYKYSITTETGIETLIGAMFAKDDANFLFSNAVVINNLNATPVLIGGDGYANRRDGGSMFGSGNIQIDNSVSVLIVETGVSGLTAQESSKLMGLDTDPLPDIKNLIEADEIHTGSTIEKRLKGTATPLLTKNWTGTPLSSFQAVEP